MKILINGSSVSSGKPLWSQQAHYAHTVSQPTWPYRLQEQLNCDMVNLALAGAGSTYIHESTIAEISQRSYDLVLIMWTEFDRTDHRVTYPGRFSSLQYTSQAQSKKTYPELEEDFVLDTEFIQQDWIFSGDLYLKPPDLGPSTGGAPRGPVRESLDKLFGYKDFLDPNILLENSLIRIISLQGVLKSMNIPYKFMYFKQPVGKHRFANLNKLIDWQNVIDEPNLFSLAHENNWWDHSTGHPTAEAYSAYADLLVGHLKDQKLV